MHLIGDVDRQFGGLLSGEPPAAVPIEEAGRVTPCCVVPLGWPRGRYGPTTRKPVEEMAHLGGYGNRAWLGGDGA
jgi:hypothetical protein